MNQRPPDRQGILRILNASRETIRRFGARRIGLFGSFVRDEQTDSSDIDLLVEFSPGQKSYDNFIHLAYFLESLLGREIELVTPESLSPYLKPYIEREVQYASFSD